MLTYSTLKHSLSLSLKSILSLFHHIEYVFSSATLLIYLSLPTFTSVYLVYSFLCFHYFQSLSHLFSPSFFLHLLCASVSSFSVPQLSTRQHSITSIKALSLSLPLAKSHSLPLQSHSYTSFSLSLFHAHKVADTFTTISLRLRHAQPNLTPTPTPSNTPTPTHCVSLLSAFSWTLNKKMSGLTTVAILTADPCIKGWVIFEKVDPIQSNESNTSLDFFLVI